MRRPLILLIFAVIVFIVLAFLPSFFGSYLMSILTTLLIFVILSESWAILSGYTGYISLGSAAFVGLGMYIAGFSQSILPFYAIIPLSGAFAALLACGLGIPSLRVRGPYFVILTFGIAELARYTLVSTYGTTQMHIKSPGQTIIFQTLLILAFLAIGLAYVVRNTKFGLGLISIKEDEDAAEASGIDTTKYKLAAWVLSSAFLGFFGPVLGAWLVYVDPTTAFDPTVSFNAVIVAVLGGSTTVIGPILGSVVITALYNTIGVLYPFQYYIILAAILIAVVRLIPLGLFQLVSKGQIALRKKTASRSI